MGTITTEYDLPRNLTLFKATGKMSPKDFQEWATQYYSGTVTKHIVWDLTEADFSDILVGDVIAIVEYAGLLDARKVEKAAIVAEDNLLAIALSKVGEVYVEKSTLPIKLQTFNTFEDARKWLGI